ncbi:MAG: AAA family ATPase [Bacteroidaceae bacterium]|nr:AAA family ATPase [Prevotella sp.]MBR3477957.1 AAA family ATPase [Bacteroidaceae bacterium]
MGIYINTGNIGFQRVRNSEYIDKSGLISVVNSTLFTERSFSCVTRSRRFGKSMAAKMLCAYYDHSCDSRQLFADLQIASDPQFEKHLNKYPVIYLDISDFVTRFKDDSIMLHINEEMKADIHEAYPDVPMKAEDDLMAFLIRINAKTNEPFIFIIDEWDAICREFKAGTAAMDNYVNWLRRMFKAGSSAQVFAGVYMTGILPVKKYKTESALNNFTEYSMVEPMELANCFGFTKDEVRALAAKHNMDFDELEKWYDGYQIGDEQSIFNPNSVMMAIKSRRCRSFWASTGAFTAVADYINMNYEGLKDDIIYMLAGGRCPVDPTGFQNDMSTINSKNDVLTALIHLGYLGYDWREDECYIPNREVAGEMANAVKENQWAPVVTALEQSKQLLKDTLAGDSDAVARAIEAVHDENTSILSYNNENSLACVLSLAYYYAKNDYIVHRELPTGKGFADIVLIPRKNVESPAIVVELKFNQDADAAIDQIKRKQYPAKVAQYTDRLLLVGISYNRQTKMHTCQIELNCP